MLIPQNNSGIDKAGIAAVLAGILLCVFAAAIPVLLMPESRSCAGTHIANFCDELAEIMGIAPRDWSETP